MMRPFLLHPFVHAAFTTGALALLGLSSGCGSGETLPGSTTSSAGSGGNGGSGGSGEAPGCVPMTGGVVGPVVPWSRGYHMYVNDIATDRDAGVILGGPVRYTLLDLGSGPIDVPDTGGDFVAKLSPEGKVLWNRVWDGSSAPRVAADACGNVVVVRAPTEEPVPNVDLSKQTLIITKLDSEGHDLWERSFRLESDVKVIRVLVDARGDAVVLGTFKGSLNLGKGAFVSPATSPAIFVAGFAGATGKTLWHMDALAQGSVGMGVELSGDLFLAGHFTRVGKVPVNGDPTQGASVVLARLDPMSKVKSLKYTGTSTPFSASVVIVSPQGDVGAVGNCPVTSNSKQWCMARFPADGSPAVQQMVGDSKLSDSSGRAAFDAEGNLLTLSDAHNINDATMPYGDHLYLTTMSPTGAILRAEDWMFKGELTPEAIHIDPAGGILFAASLDNEADLGLDVGHGPVGPTIMARLAP